MLPLSVLPNAPLPARPKPTRPQTALAGRPTHPQATPACRMQGRPTRPQTAQAGKPPSNQTFTSAENGDPRGRSWLRSEGPADRRLSGEIRRVTVLEACDYPLATSHFRRLPAGDSHLHGSPPLGRRHALHTVAHRPARLMSPRGGVTDHQAAAFRAAREVGWSLRARLDDLEQHTLELQRRVSRRRRES
jgi:hypothetical protein